MKDKYRTKDELIEELVKLRTRVADLEKRESEKICQTLIENANEVIIVVQDGLAKFVNSKATELSGYSKEKIISRPFTEFIHPDDREMVKENYLRRLKGEEAPHLYSFRFIDKEGNIRWGEINAALIDWEGKPATLNFLTDITERKRAEEALKESKHNYRILFENTLDGVFVIDSETMKVVLANQAVARMCGIDSVEDVIGADLFDFIPPEEKDRTSKIIVEDMFEHDLRQVNQFQTTTKDGRTIWVEAIGARIKYRGRLAGLVSIRDITERKKTEKKLQRTLEKLRKALGATIKAMMLTVETRDAYTAGHQRRVTDLARAIAKEMGLSERQIDGFRMAASIHDIGKIGVPAEILNKPGHLSNIEFNLIKIHPVVGYNILKKIQFPWPVAEIVLQHHERMNGSGYPHGLSGEDILLEARILGVADVVEAMVSHRPYRPAFSIDKALEEISHNKGILYDPRVVDACLKLFREKKFKFE